MYSICIQYVFNMYSICIQYVFNMYSICIQYVFNMYSICIQYVFNMYSICIQYEYEAPFNPSAIPMPLYHCLPSRSDRSCAALLCVVSGLPGFNGIDRETVRLPRQIQYLPPFATHVGARLYRLYPFGSVTFAWAFCLRPTSEINLLRRHAGGPVSWMTFPTRLNHLLDRHIRGPRWRFRLIPLDEFVATNPKVVAGFYSLPVERAAWLPTIRESEKAAFATAKCQIYQSWFDRIVVLWPETLCRDDELNQCGLNFKPCHERASTIWEMTQAQCFNCLAWQIGFKLYGHVKVTANKWRLHSCFFFVRLCGRKDPLLRVSWQQCQCPYPRRTHKFIKSEPNTEETFFGTIPNNSKNEAPLRSGSAVSRPKLNMFFTFSHSLATPRCFCAHRTDGASAEQNSAPVRNTPSRSTASRNLAISSAEEVLILHISWYGGTP